MSDRIVRDELLKSDRWLDLPSDTHRLTYIVLLLLADDFGNLEAGTRRLFRELHQCTQVKTEEAMASVFTHLLDADLIRGYAVEGRQYYHLPRFRTHRQYLVRKVPGSEWDVDPGRELGKSRRVENRGLAKDQELAKKVATTSQPHSSNVAAMSQRRSNDVAEGVEVGVEVGVGEKLNAPRSLDDPEIDVVKKAMFDLGVRIITAAGGSERSARSLLAGLAKNVGDAVVLEKLGYLAANPKVEPTSWLAQACRVKTAAELLQEKVKLYP